MAILIRGVEMPTSCLYCPCFDGEYDICKAADKDEGLSFDHRPSWCPLVEVPRKPRYDADLLRDCGMEE